MSRKSVVILFLLASLGLLTHAYAWRAPMQGEAGAPVEVFTGYLGVIWTDYKDGRHGETAFLLQQTQGDEFVLLPGQAAENELALLAGREVILEGRVAQIAGAAESRPVLIVDSVQAAAADGREPNSEQAAAQQISGNTRWISIGCKFPDRLTEAHSISYFDGMYANTFPGLDHYWREVSNNHINLQDSSAIGWYILPHPYSYYVNSSGGFGTSAFRDDCLAAADADIYFPDYYGFNLLVNSDDLDTAYGSVGVLLELDGVTQQWATTWMTQWTHEWISEFEHEMGHGYGLFHSYVNNRPGPYANVWDVMSRDEYNCDVFYDAVYGCYGQHTITYNKDKLGWIEPAQIYTAAVGSQTIALERSAQPGSSGYLMAKIPVGDSTTHYYTLEARRLVGYDNKLPGNAVIIHEIGIPPRMIWLVAEYADGPDAMWLPGETFYSCAGGISVHIEATTATGYVVTITRGLDSAMKVLQPSDDTYINRLVPNMNYGSESTLLADPTGADYHINKLAMVKFTREQIPATSCQMRLNLTVLGDIGLDPPNELRNAPATLPGATTPWTETDLTWNSGVMPEYLSLEPPVTDGSSLTWDVTYLVNAYGSPSFAIGGGDISGTTTYSSKEGSDPPLLIVDYLLPAAPITATPTSSPGPSPTPTATDTAGTATPSGEKTPGPTLTPSATAESGQPGHIIWLPIIRR